MLCSHDTIQYRDTSSLTQTHTDIQTERETDTDTYFCLEIMTCDIGTLHSDRDPDT